MGCSGLCDADVWVLEEDTRPAPAPAPSRCDTQDWQFSPSEFAELSETLGGFTLDAAADVSGSNAHCSRFCSSHASFLARDLQGERIWANFPFTRMGEFLELYTEHKALYPDLCGAFVIPAVDALVAFG